MDQRRHDRGSKAGYLLSSIGAGLIVRPTDRQRRAAGGLGEVSSGPSEGAGLIGCKAWLIRFTLPRQAGHSTDAAREREREETCRQERDGRR